MRTVRSVLVVCALLLTAAAAPAAAAPADVSDVSTDAASVVADDETNATRTDVDYTMYGQVVYNYVDAKGTVAPEAVDRIRRVDFEADAGSVDLDGEGEVAVTFAKPTAGNDTTVETGSLYVLNSENERVNASSVEVADGDVTARFADADLRSLAQAGDLELYGDYQVAGEQRPYFADWTLNAALDASVVSQSTTTATSTAPDTTAATTTAAETTTAPATTESGESGGGSPGFGAGAALVAALAAALLATRRA